MSTAPTPTRPVATAPAPPPPAKPRRNTRLILLGIALAVLFALLAAYMVGQAGTPRSVVVVTEDVAAGEQLDEDNLGVTEVTGGDALATIPADRMRGLMGRRTTTALSAGSLASEESLAQRIVPRSGQVIVGVPLTAGQYPTTGLRAGDSVRLVVTGGGASVEGLTPGRAFPGAVLAVGEPDENGRRTVDLSIPSGVADLAAAAAGSEQIAIINAAPAGAGAPAPTSSSTDAAGEG